MATKYPQESLRKLRTWGKLNSQRRLLDESDVLSRAERELRVAEEELQLERRRAEAALRETAQRLQSGLPAGELQAEQSWEQTQRRRLAHAAERVADARGAHDAARVAVEDAQRTAAEALARSDQAQEQYRKWSREERRAAEEQELAERQDTRYGNGVLKGSSS